MTLMTTNASNQPTLISFFRQAARPSRRNTSWCMYFNTFLLLEPRVLIRLEQLVHHVTMDTIRLRTTQAPTAVKDPATPLKRTISLADASSASTSSYSTCLRIHSCQQGKVVSAEAAPQCHHRNNRTQSDHHQTG